MLHDDHTPTPAADVDPAIASRDELLQQRYTYRLRFTEHALSPSNPCLGEVLTSHDGDCRVLPVVDGGLADADPTFVQSLAAYLTASDGTAMACPPVIVPGGEAAKNGMGVFNTVIEAINEHDICRHSVVLVAGGGAVLDAVGFASSCAHRGVGVVRLPSTTVSQGDGGLGVKNGLNAMGKKNFLGTFDPPHAVVNDHHFLATLSDRDYRCGFSEAVKVAMLKDEPFFNEIETLVPALLARDDHATQRIIQRSAHLHLDHIVHGGDPFEQRVARPLDMGHWSAHRLESLSKHEIRHGEAVAIGLALDAQYAALVGLLDEELLHRLLAVLSGIGFDLSHPLMRDRAALLGGMEEFRQHLGGQLTITLPSRLGSSQDVHEIDDKIMDQAISMRLD
jgi:3-dehydroquinate synthase